MAERSRSAARSSDRESRSPTEGLTGLADVLQRVSRHLGELTLEDLKRFGMTMPRWLVLSQLAVRDGQSIGDLSRGDRYQVAAAGCVAGAGDGAGDNDIVVHIVSSLIRLFGFETALQFGDFHQPVVHFFTQFGKILAPSHFHTTVDHGVAQFIG